ncbi:MAG: GNAT family N-acetyltransferase [Deltaproteobacteria bacterium]|nr:GNAT family N-acetyltransferase [Deltaproteobacteria bacterium]
MIARSLLVKRIHARHDLERAYAIRVRVFVEEQGVPREIELDQDDKRAIHFLAYVGDRAVGTTRVVIQQGKAKIGRMAVLRRYRGKGVGSALLGRALNLIRKKQVKTIFLNAQVPVIAFYQKLGFRCVGRTFGEAGIPHRKMTFTGNRHQNH